MHAFIVVVMLAFIGGVWGLCRLVAEEQAIRNQRNASFYRISGLNEKGK